MRPHLVNFVRKSIGCFARFTPVGKGTLPFSKHNPNLSQKHSRFCHLLKVHDRTWLRDTGTAKKKYLRGAKNYALCSRDQCTAQSSLISYTCPVVEVLNTNASTVL